jgi:DNA ligase (NAD+)
MEKVFKNPQATEEFHDYLRTEEARFQRDFPHLVDRTLIPYSIAEQIAHNGLRSRHDYPMQAYRSEHDLGGLVRWVDRCGTKGDILMFPAIRGVHVELVYQGGVLHKAVNMGDGLEGKDITLNMYSVNGVPQQIPENERVNIHGIVTMDSIAVMAMHRDPEVQVEMAVATALMNSFNDKRDPDGISALQFIPYMVNIPGVAYNLSDLRSILLAWDFMGLEAWHMKGTTRELGEFDEVTTAYKEKVLNRLIYPTEGITFQVNDTHDRLTLGHTSRWPEWSLKYIMGKPYVNAESKDVNVEPS